MQPSRKRQGPPLTEGICQLLCQGQSRGVARLYARVRARARRARNGTQRHPACGGQREMWLGLFAADGIYWLPIDEQADPEREPSIIYDDATQRAKRVFQLRQGSHYAQVPPSRTVHVISNV